MHFPVNTSPAPTCADCGLLDQCGGLVGDSYHKGCFQRCNEWCRSHGCDMVCLTNAIVFSEMVAEIEGLDTLPRQALSPMNKTVKLPMYVPQINHGASRKTVLREPVISIPLYEIIAKDRRGRVRVRYNSADDLRRGFQLSANTQFIISSVAPDRYIEDFWAHHQSQQLLIKIECLKPLAMTVPNFSFMLDVPRTNNLYNFGRMFRMAERMTAAGIPTILHLNALTPFDWNRWLTVLREQPESNMVTVEFQTGAGRKDFGNTYFTEIVSLQDKLGRALHPLVLAGGGKIRQVYSEFDSFTVIDSIPFIKTMNRQVLRKWGDKWKWRMEPTIEGVTLETRMARNIKMQRVRLHEILGLTWNGHGDKQLQLPIAA